MSGIWRLEGKVAPELSRPLIDRHSAIAFSLDGRRFEAFAGDSVLSALLANGIEAVGRDRAHPVALNEGTAPPVALEGNENRPDLAMPMSLCPALDGVRLVTLGRRRRRTSMGRLVHAMTQSRNGLNLDPARQEPAPWIDTAPARSIRARYAIIGGGIAGMAAAVRAAQRGGRVVLIEREPVLGGTSVMFGKADGEPDPAEAIAGLARQIENNDRITVLTRTHAFDISGDSVEAIGIATEGGIPRPERLSVRARHILLASGLVEILPIFPGNRLPRVQLSGFAWRMAARYNVWLGNRAHIHSATNVAYRMALLGADNGKSVVRASDSRPDPQSRFIEFCKAYGFRLSRGAVIAHARWQSGRGNLTIRLADAERGGLHPDTIDADSLIVSGGWQPEIELWLRAGGVVDYDEARHRLKPARDAGVVQIGAAAGFKSLSGCRDSAVAAVDWLAKGKESRIDDPVIDPMFETPDGEPLVSRPRDRKSPPAYLSAGPGLGILPAPRRNGWTALLPRRSASGEPVAAAALGPSDVLGAIAAGLVDPRDAGILCSERCVLPRKIGPPPRLAVAEVAPEAIPAYLYGRFGPDQTVRAFHPGSGLRQGVGCLLFANTDDTDPGLAVGVVVALAREGTPLVLTTWSEGAVVYIRDGINCTSGRLGSAIPM